MGALIGAIGLLALATVATAVTVARGARPGEPRRHLFEDERGERENPFADLSAGAAAAAERCQGCGDSLPSVSYSYCSSCESFAPADD